MTPQDELKRQAAVAAVARVESGMVVGLGTGSTAQFALERLAELINIGKLKNIVGIPSSLRTEKAARELGIPLTDFAAHPVIDLTIDGADEVDPDLNLIKGGGGALLREKVLAQASRCTRSLAKGRLDSYSCSGSVPTVHRCGGNRIRCCWSACSTSTSSSRRPARPPGNTRITRSRSHVSPRAYRCRK